LKARRDQQLKCRSISRDIAIGASVCPDIFGEGNQNFAEFCHEAPLARWTETSLPYFYDDAMWLLFDAKNWRGPG
jgi:hypothetical protein